MELQVRQEAGGVGDHVGDRGGSLRAGESGDAGSDGGLFIKGFSGDAVAVNVEMKDRAKWCAFLSWRFLNLKEISKSDQKCPNGESRYFRHCLGKKGEI